MIIDITPTITPSTVVWPGDVAFEQQRTWDQERGDSVTVSAIRATTHLGAHIDAPLHVRQGAPHSGDISLEACVGACVVLDIRHLVDTTTRPHAAAQSARIVTELEQQLQATGRSTKHPVERLLLRHRDQVMTNWDANIPGIDPEFVTWFGEQGGLLLGIDLASFDPASDTDLRAHQAAVDAGVTMLEGLDLQHAPVGHAELFALPLAIDGADAVPVRAILRLPVLPVS